MQIASLATELILPPETIKHTSFSSSPAPFLQSFMSVPPCVCQFLHPICLFIVPILHPPLSVKMCLILPIFPLSLFIYFNSAPLLCHALGVFFLNSIINTYVFPSSFDFCTSDWQCCYHSPTPFPIPFPLSHFFPSSPHLVFRSSFLGYATFVAVSPTVGTQQDEAASTSITLCSV